MLRCLTSKRLRGPARAREGCHAVVPVVLELKRPSHIAGKNKNISLPSTAVAAENPIGGHGAYSRERDALCDVTARVLWRQLLLESNLKPRAPEW